MSDAPRISPAVLVVIPGGSTARRQEVAPRTPSRLRMSGIGLAPAGVACLAFSIKSVTILCLVTLEHFMLLFVTLCESNRTIATSRALPKSPTARWADEEMPRGVVIAGSRRQSEGPDDDGA